MSVGYVGCLSCFDMLNDPPHSCRFLLLTTLPDAIARRLPYSEAAGSVVGPRLNEMEMGQSMSESKPMKLPYDWGNDHLFTGYDLGYLGYQGFVPKPNVSVFLIL